jgi:hypothetical protein
MPDPRPIDPRGDSVYSESSDPGIPPVIFRAGKPNPGNLKPRAVDNGKFSFSRPERAFACSGEMVR